MTTWLHSAPSNLTIRTHQRNLFKGQDSPPERPELQVEETLDFQEEYPQEVAEEVEEEEEEEEGIQEFLSQRPHLKELPMQETS